MFLIFFHAVYLPTEPMGQSYLMLLMCKWQKHLQLVIQENNRIDKRPIT